MGSPVYPVSKHASAWYTRLDRLKSRLRLVDQLALACQRNLVPRATS